MILTAEKVTGGYGERKIFSDLSFSVEKGQLLTLLGPNGVGKSTLLKTVAGLLPVMAGEVHLDGKNIALFSAKMRARHICYLPQNYSPFLPFRVEEVIMMGRAPYVPIWRGPGKNDLEIVKRVITDLGIEHLADKECTELSGGELRLMLIARAMVQEPNFLLLDEPAAALDTRNEGHLLEILEKMLGQGIGMIMATHNPEHGVKLGGREMSLGG